MNSKLQLLKCLLITAMITFSFLWSSFIRAQEDTGGTHQVFAEELLKVGAIQIKAPVFDSIENLKGKPFGLEEMQKFEYLNFDDLKPRENFNSKIKGSEIKWEKVKASKDHFSIAERRPEKGIDQLCYFATYIEVDRWMEANIEISSPQLYTAFIDGKKFTSKTSLDKSDDENIGSTNKDIKLETGKHLLLIKSIKPSGSETDWKAKVAVSFDEKYSTENLGLTLLPEKSMDINALMDGVFMSSVSISPDGELVLLKYSSKSPPEGKSESWAEIRNLNSNMLIQSFRNSKVSGLQWTPQGRKLSYRTSTKDNGTTIWVFDLELMTEKAILKNIKELSDYTWSDDESFIIYSISEKPDKNKNGLNKLEGMPDRWPWWRSRSFLYQFDVTSGFSERLTYGHLSTYLHDIRPDGKKILFSIDTPDFSERPYSKQYLIEMDMESYALDTIWVNRFSGSCNYSPDGENLIVTGSPVLFGDLGISIRGDGIPNDYDTQAYIYNLPTGDVNAITLSFDPSINQAIWSKYDANKIYLRTIDGTYVNIFQYDLNTRYFEKVNTGFDVTSSLSIASDSPIAVCRGSKISTPHFANSINLQSGEVTEIANPRKEDFENVVFGKTEEWTFKNYSGVEIAGTIYYPPGFDKDSKYPLIVYYYGGTSPVDRNFGGRYPKNLFAAQGYVVYVLQPSGATGFGQTFSSHHVNNWGITVADEIIMGTQLFVETHTFIDQEKVGCIGASYGGFMTMLLQTRTDIFSAAISHAGISSISSYWGEGYWGYLYSSVASANSFPWNNSELYIGQSPLFNADKINTPLLLLHGSVDTNVPTGESIQLYTALKLLGKPVELIEVEGQNHRIVDYKKRIAWQKTIFSWFDKWLKDQPEWWNELYPDTNL